MFIVPCGSSQVQKPAAVVRAQQQGCNGAPRDMSDEEVLSTIVAYQLAVNSYVTVARQLLSAYGGYECKVRTRTHKHIQGHWHTHTCRPGTRRTQHIPFGSRGRFIAVCK